MKWITMFFSILYDLLCIIFVEVHYINTHIYSLTAGGFWEKWYLDLVKILLKDLPIEDLLQILI